ncbi:MAG: hypothetical protein HRF50_03875 [Phycisphaerae bacterium]|jgi:poly(3-hydroxybutyrate) depolymerase
MKLRAAIIGILACSSAARPDEPAILAGLRDFFAAASAEQRREAARRIETDPAYDRASIRRWLHAAGLFEPIAAGVHSLSVPLGGGAARSVRVRIPSGYDAGQPYPLIYTLHGTSGDGDSIIGYVERLLGERVEQYVVAAPTGYEDVVIHQARWPPTGEHPAALLAIKRFAHIDSDRVYLTGYSRGGHASWTLAMLYADEFAGAMPIAGTFLLEQIDGLWDQFLPNARQLPILAVWGKDDRLDSAGARSAHGGIAGLNGKLVNVARDLGLPLTPVELEGKGHADIAPPAAELDRLLAARRVHFPARVAHAFRHIGQASAYWLEGHEWTGPQWTDRPPVLEFQPGEHDWDDQHVRNASVRAFRRLLGELEGEISGQTLRVRRNKVRELTVWFGDGMINWDEPVALLVGGKKEFEGALRPDLFVCLTQAERTRDFERLRWAGLRVRTGSRTQVVTGETEFAQTQAPRVPGGKE